MAWDGGEERTTYRISSGAAEGACECLLDSSSACAPLRSFALQSNIPVDLPHSPYCSPSASIQTPSPFPSLPCQPSLELSSFPSIPTPLSLTNTLHPSFALIQYSIYRGDASGPIPSKYNRVDQKSINNLGIMNLQMKILN